MENIEASQKNQVTPVITGVDNVISTYKEVIKWGENKEPDILPKELYDAFFEFVAFNLGTKQPFLEKISEFLYLKHDVLLSDILQNQKFSGQLTTKEAFDYLRRYGQGDGLDTRRLLMATYNEFTSKEYDDLIEILDSPIGNEDQRQAFFQNFQNIFEKTDHRSFLRALWMFKWVLTGITENSFLYKYERCEPWHWRHAPMFHPSIQKDYLEFLIFHAVFGNVYEGFIPTPLFRQSRAEQLFIPEYEQYDCKNTYYQGRRDIIKDLDSKIVNKINDLSALYRYGEDVACENICTNILISGLVNALRKNGYSINTAGKFNQNWFSRWSQQFIEDYEMPEDERDSLTNNTITVYASLDDCAIRIMNSFYSDYNNEHIQTMGECILLYSKMMFDVYNVVKDILDEEQNQELLQMLKRCYYTNCLLPYYVDDNEPTDTNEDHPLSTTDIDKSDDRPLWEKSLPPILKKPRFIAAH